MAACIYCLEDKEPAEFNAEHVLPRAFGTFENNLTLHCVCVACNGYFGRQLELFFSRGSWEAYLRYSNRLKPLEELGEIRSDRLVVTLAEPGDWHGVKVCFVEQDDECVVELEPQVGFLSKTSGDWVFLTERELDDDPQALANENLDKETAIKLFVPSEEAQARLTAKLTGLGISFRALGRLSPLSASDGTAPVQVKTLLDTVAHRCIAKIAFNYLAWKHGAQFALRPDFNVIRSFIRIGTTPSYPLLVADMSPILGDDLPALRQTNGHLITLNWSLSGKDIVSQVSLFNAITYAVSLSRDFSGIWWQDLRSGHHFDITRRRITELLGTGLFTL